MVTDKLKGMIFKKLYDDLSHVEIIPYNDSIWFVDRKEQYWYFELNQSGKLWWRYGFFESFFSLFSLNMEIYMEIISEWVEEVLNSNVNASCFKMDGYREEVGDVLTNTVNTSMGIHRRPMVEVIINHLENIEHNIFSELHDSVNVSEKWRVNEVLSHQVTETSWIDNGQTRLVGDVLKYKVRVTAHDNLRRQLAMEKISEI